MRRVRSERGIAVLVVLVVIAIGALAGTVALLAARSASEGASVSANRVQSRLTMRSGVLILEQEAIAQREAVLGGADFELDVPFEVFAQGERSGVFRLDATLTEAPVSLDALLDVNTADATMLAGLPGLDETIAGAIVARLPVRSLGELLGVEGVTVELLYGEYDDSGRLISDMPPLASLLTVGSVEPGLTSGVGETPAGRKRVGIDRFAYSSFEPELAELIGEAAARECVQFLLGMSSTPAPPGPLASAALKAGVEPTTVGLWLDALAGEQATRAGCVDITRAPVEVLAVIPGFGPEVAQQIVDARQSLAAEEMASILWPLEQGIVDEESMLKAVDRVTTRSVRWVLRAEAGMSAADRARSVGVDSIEDVQRIRTGMAAAQDDRLSDRVAMDLLVDFSGSRPAVVPLGEVSIAGELAVVARALGGGDRIEDEGAMARAPEVAP